MERLKHLKSFSANRLPVDDFAREVFLTLIEVIETLG